MDVACFFVLDTHHVTDRWHQITCNLEINQLATGPILLQHEQPTVSHWHTIIALHNVAFGHVLTTSTTRMSNSHEKGTACCIAWRGNTSTSDHAAAA